MVYIVTAIAKYGVMMKQLSFQNIFFMIDHNRPPKPGPGSEIVLFQLLSF